MLLPEFFPDVDVREENIDENGDADKSDRKSGVPVLPGGVGDGSWSSSESLSLSCSSSGRLATDCDVLMGARIWETLKDGIDLEYSLGSYGILSLCPNSLMALAADVGPGEDRVEDDFVGLVIPRLLEGEKAGSPMICEALGSAVDRIGPPASGESGRWMTGSVGQLWQKKRRGRAASCTDRIAAASLVILGDVLLDRHSLLVQSGCWQPTTSW